MSWVYRYALCNIAATAAENGTIGFSIERNNLGSYLPFTINYKGQIFIVDRMRDYQSEVVEGPLNGRAWVLQEYYLSNRIFHFASGGVWWQCAAKRKSDASGWRAAQYNDLDLPVSILKDLVLENPSEGSAAPVSASWTGNKFKQWVRTCSSYTKRDLSFESDKLIAMDGLGNLFSKSTGDMFVWGLWKKHLIVQLLWMRAHRHSMPALPLASWTWASHKGEIRFVNHINCGKSRDKALLKHVDVEAPGSGLAQVARLILQGKLLHGSLHIKDPPRSRVNYGHPGILEVDGHRQEIAYAILDDLLFGPIKLSVTFMGIYEDLCDDKDKHGSKGPFWQLGALILQQTEDNPELYRRIGVLLLEKESADFYKAIEPTEHHEITII